MTKIFMHTNGVIQEKDNLANFLFWDLGVDIQSLPSIPKWVIPQFNQYAYTKTKSWCTFVNNYRVACYVAGVHPVTQDYLDLIDYATKMVHYIPWTPRGVTGAKDTVRKFMKEHHNIDMTTIQSNKDDPNYTDMLKKWYPAVFSYNGNHAYNLDYQSDNELNWAKFWASSYWHCTVHKLDNWAIYVDDSDYWHPYSIYKVDQLPQLYQNYVWNYNVYFFIKTPTTIDVEKIKRTTQLRAICQNISDECTIARPLTDDSIFQAHLDETKQVMMARVVDCNTVLAQQ